MSNSPIDRFKEPAAIEMLASLEHARWSHWQEYLHNQCIANPDGSLTIPAPLVDRWTKQIKTPYASLSSEEKESDREQIRPFIDALDRILQQPHP